MFFLMRVFHDYRIAAWANEGHGHGVEPPVTDTTLLPSTGIALGIPIADPLPTMRIWTETASSVF
jgi:hypothetical protein